MTINFERGFRRLSWIVALVSLPVIAWFAYQMSLAQTGYRKFAIGPGEAFDSSSYQSVVLEGIGVAYFPKAFSKKEMEEQLLRWFPKNAKPVSKGELSISQFVEALRRKQAAGDARITELLAKSDTETAANAIAKYPEYESQVAFDRYRVEPYFEKRPWWAAGVTVVAFAVLVLLLQGGVSLAAWVVRGFKQGAA